MYWYLVNAGHVKLSDENISIDDIEQATEALAAIAYQRYLADEARRKNKT